MDGIDCGFSSLWFIMNKENIQKTNHHEEPLFVLKYSWWRILSNLFIYSLFYLICLYLIFYAKPSPKVSPLGVNFARIALLLILVGSLWFIYEMIGTKGIYLYNDRVIKRYRFRKNEKVVLLERAIYNGPSIYLKIITLSENKILFCNLLSMFALQVC